MCIRDRQESGCLEPEIVALTQRTDEIHICEGAVRALNQSAYPGKHQIDQFRIIQQLSLIHI